MKKYILPIALLAGAAYAIFSTKSAPAGPPPPPPNLPPLPPGTLPGTTTPPPAPGGSTLPTNPAPTPAALTIPAGAAKIGDGLGALQLTYGYKSPTLGPSTMLDGYYMTGSYVGTVVQKGLGWYKVRTYTPPFLEDPVTGADVQEFYISDRAYRKTN